MTINQAAKHLFNSDTFKEAAKQEAALRVYLGRYNKGKLKNGSLIELLLKYNYKIGIEKPISKKKKRA